MRSPYPVRLRSRTVAHYRLGLLRAHVYSEIESPGPITYEYLLEVRDTAGALELVVSAEVSDLGTRCIGVFSPRSHANYPEQERIAHAADFEERAFAIAGDWLGRDFTASVLFEQLGPNLAGEVPRLALRSLVAPLE